MRESTRTCTTDPLRGPETGGSPVSGPKDVSVMTIWKDPAVFLRQRAEPETHSRSDLHHRPVTGTRNGRLARFGTQRRVCDDDLEGSRGISAAATRTRNSLRNRSVRMREAAHIGNRRSST